MTDRYCKSLAQIYNEVFIYDAYGDPISTITGSSREDRQRPLIMVAELSGNADPPCEMLVLDPLMAVRLAMRLMNHAALILGAERVAAIRDETYKLTDAIADDETS